MKSYSGHGLLDAKLARSRRTDFDGRSWRGLCRGRVPLHNGGFQLDNTFSGCSELALSEDSGYFLWFSGSLEEWLDGFPEEKYPV